MWRVLPISNSFFSYTSLAIPMRAVRPLGGSYLICKKIINITKTGTPCASAYNTTEVFGLTTQSMDTQRHLGRRFAQNQYSEPSNPSFQVQALPVDDKMAALHFTLGCQHCSPQKLAASHPHQVQYPPN